MTDAPVVSNSSPLIALYNIGHLEVVEHLFSHVVIPPAVQREVSPGLRLPSWIEIHTLDPDRRVPVLPAAALGLGERAAITLAQQLAARWLLLDDLPARRAAESLGLPVIGTLGILLAAKRQGILPSLRSSLDALIAVGFRFTPSLRKEVLRAAGEDE